MRRLTGGDWWLLLSVFMVALVLRVLWVSYLRQPDLVVQWPDPRISQYARSVAKQGIFAGAVPLSSPAAAVQRSASLSPAYPYFLAWFYQVQSWLASGEGEPRVEERVTQAVGLAQCVLGALTAVMIFLIAYQAFDTRAVAVLAGLLAAVHFFWVVNTSQLADGVLATFLLTTALALGLRLVQRPGTVTAIGFGLALGLLAMTRASFLLLAWLAMLWMIWRLCRQPRGWAWALVGVVVWVATLLPWTWRNWQLFEGAPGLSSRLVPIVSRAGLDLWWGNNDEATGGLAARPVPGQPPLLDMTEVIPPGRRRDLAELPETQRFQSLLRQAYLWIQDNPGRFAELRLRAGVYFFTGQRLWLASEPEVQAGAPPAGQPRLPIEGSEDGEGGLLTPPKPTPPVAVDEVPAPEGLEDLHPEVADTLPPPDPWTPWVLLAFAVASVAGMRWSYRWRDRQGLLTLALIGGALPAVLSHADLLHGPRLPLDGVLLVYSAFALCCLVPGLSRRLRQGPRVSPP